VCVRSHHDAGSGTERRYASRRVSGTVNVTVVLSLVSNVRSAPIVVIAHLSWQRPSPVPCWSGVSVPRSKDPSARPGRWGRRRAGPAGQPPRQGVDGRQCLLNGGDDVNLFRPDAEAPDTWCGHTGDCNSFTHQSLLSEETDPFRLDSQFDFSRTYNYQYQQTDSSSEPAEQQTDEYADPEQSVRWRTHRRWFNDVGGVVQPLERLRDGDAEEVSSGVVGRPR